ncbi:MAG TPA: hypothetical protein VJL29_03900 [Thermoguttaceae bacterium]|nr:hypothetical protein [Thermoguttaceae bacterium]
MICRMKLSSVAAAVCLAMLAWTSVCSAAEPATVLQPPVLKVEVLQRPAAPADAKNESSEAKIARALESRVRLELVDASLDDFCRELAKQFGINVVIDREALEEYGISECDPLDFSCRDLPTKTALQAALRTLKLTWIIHHEVLFVTTEDVAEESTEVIVYDVADLVTTFRADGTYTIDAGPLHDLITATAEPDRWVHAGGNGTIEIFEADRLQVFVIMQTREVHEQIRRLLAMLRTYVPKQTPDNKTTSRAGYIEPRVTEPKALESPEEEKIHRALSKRIDVDFDQVPLSEFAAKMGALMDIEVRLDKETLAEFEITPDMPVTLRVSSISAASVLRLALSDLELGWIVKDDCLLICCLDYAHENPMVMIHDVADLVETGGKGDEPDFEPLMGVITGSIQPEWWADMGGTATIMPLAGGGSRVLVVSQTWEGHEQIRNLLAQLRKIRREGQGRPMPRERKPASTRPDKA